MKVSVKGFVFVFLFFFNHTVLFCGLESHKPKHCVECMWILFTLQQVGELLFIWAFLNWIEHFVILIIM